MSNEWREKDICNCDQSLALRRMIDDTLTRLDIIARYGREYLTGDMRAETLGCVKTIRASLTAMDEATETYENE